MLKAGSIIENKYQIEHLIAEGGMAEVYLATLVDPSCKDQYVAIKRLQPRLRFFENISELFIREAQHIIQIRSDYIVRGIELINTESELLLVMDYILGLNVSRAVAKLSKQSLKIRSDIAQAVGIAVGRALKCIAEYPDAHGKALNLVHGDISAQNIILGANGHIILVDFGVAVAMNEAKLTPNKSLHGTRRYMSPEQVLGQPLSQSSDIYSLGIVLEEIIGEKLDINNNLQKIITKAQAKNRVERYDNIGDFLDDFKKLSVINKINNNQELLNTIFSQQVLSSAAKNKIIWPRIISVGSIFMLVAALVIAGATRYFQSRMPDVANSDHHCDH